MTFSYASIALASALAALAVGSACTGTSPTCETGDCFGEGVDAGPPDDAGCPSGTVLVLTSTNASTSSGCYASASCGAPIPSAVGPTTWSAARQECASYPDSLITTTPCDGFVALVPGFSNGEPDASVTYYGESDVYDVTTGALVAVIGVGPGSSYVCSYGEVAIPLDCLAPLTNPTTPCTSFDAGLED
jgi:hypothetical protein